MATCPEFPTGSEFNRVVLFGVLNTVFEQFFNFFIVFNCFGLLFCFIIYFQLFSTNTPSLPDSPGVSAYPPPHLKFEKSFPVFL
jgi:hypothetical protein